MKHTRTILYIILPFLFFSAGLTAQETPPPRDNTQKYENKALELKPFRYDIDKAIINPKYADSVPIKQLLPRADRTIKSKLPNCYVIEGDSIIVGMKYTYKLLFVTEVQKKYCNGVTSKTRSKGFLPDSIYEIVWKNLEKRKANNLSYTADDAMHYFEEAKQQLTRNHNGAAIAGFLIAADIHKSVKEASLINIGLGLYNLKLYEDAIYYYELAIKENPKSYEAYLNMGAAAKQVKNDSGFSMESVYFKIAYNLKPHAHKAIYNYATTLMSQFDRKNNDLAIKLLNEAISLDPQNATYIWVLGKAYHNASNMGNQQEAILWYQKAIAQYDKAISIDKNLHEAYLSKARSLHRLYEASGTSADKKTYMDAMNVCYTAFKAVGGEDKTDLFKRNMFNYPTEQKSVPDFNALIPKGWKIRDKVEDDFNKDGHPDFALVIQQNDPAKIVQIIRYNLPDHPAGVLNQNPSILYVALYNPITAQYDILARNNQFYQITNAYEDHLYKLSSSKGTLKITRAYTSLGKPNSFWLRYQNNKMEVIGREINYLRWDKYEENYSINYSTKKLVYTITNLKTRKTFRFEYSDIQEPYPGDIEDIKETINLDNNPYIKTALFEQ